MRNILLTTVLLLLWPAGILPAVAAEAAPAAESGSASFFRLGVEHVLGGWDHLLFAAALVVALRTFWEVFKVIGVFTIAHSITVTLVAFGIVTPPSGIIEPLVAISIIIVALENIFLPSGAVSRRRMAIAFGFGLIHGLALAGEFTDSLSSLGLSGSQVAWAVAAFCIGVEIGHLCIVAPLSGLLKIGRDFGREAFQQASMRYGSLLIALGGTYYLLASLGMVPSPE